jgi:hypothetical protein
MGRKLGLLLASVLLLLPGQSSPAAALKPLPNVYTISFDHHGDLVNPHEKSYAIEDIADKKIERIIVVAHGWATAGETSSARYVEIAQKIIAESQTSPAWDRTAFIGVVWDSSQTGLRRWLNNLMPGPLLGDVLAFVPDLALFPFSFWSKASMADLIGERGLRAALDDLLAQSYAESGIRPELYLIGHSFGTRIIHGLLEAAGPASAPRPRGSVMNSLSSFFDLASVSGVLFVQPALSEARLDRLVERHRELTEGEELPFPLIVAMNRHDHANGFLFPVANMLMNVDALAAVSRLYRSVGTRLTPRWIGERQYEPFRSHILNSQWFFKLYTELIQIPVTASSSVALLSYQYASTQLSLISSDINYLPDTLAQLPLVEVAMDQLSRGLGREVEWGRHSKGAFTMGASNESMGRMTRGGFGRYTPESLASSLPCGLPVCGGVIPVDMSDHVDRGSWYKWGLNEALVDYTLGWLDPIGAHSDYMNEPMYALLDRILRISRARGDLRSFEPR